MAEHLVLVGLRLGIVLVGALLALMSLRLALGSRSNQTSFLLLAFGFGLVTLGALIEGVLFELAGWNLTSAHAVEALVSGSGFVLILLSILRSEVRELPQPTAEGGLERGPR
ncbi:MAG: hypothetical protein ACE5I4_06975 [Thermoplasmata archaeon]